MTTPTDPTAEDHAARDQVADDLGDSRPVREAVLLFGAMFVSGIVMVVVGFMIFGNEPKLQKFRHPDAAPTRGHIEPGRTNVITSPAADR